VILDAQCDDVRNVPREHRYWTSKHSWTSPEQNAWKLNMTKKRYSSLRTTLY